LRALVPFKPLSLVFTFALAFALRNSSGLLLSFPHFMRLQSLIARNTT
jgi:hypothetical protein